MKPKHLLIHALVISLALPLLGTSAQAAISIQVIETFDYPGGAGTLTRPQKINDTNEIVGEYVDGSGAVRGFVRARNGGFTPPIVEPNDNSNFTEGRGINNAKTVVGDYLNGTYHGFFLTGSTYTEFDVAGSTSTEVLGINNAGDFSGNYTASDGTAQAFVDVGGTLDSFTVSGASLIAAYQLNRTNDSVGYFVDSGGINHGFFRQGDGTLNAPIDPPGSTGTILFGINDQRWMVGRYVDNAFVTHGLFFIFPNKFVSFDYPGATFTSLNGVNKKGFICGRYTDASGIEHGFLARVRQGAADQPDTEIKATSPSSPVRVNTPAPELRSPLPAS